MVTSCLCDTQDRLAGNACVLAPSAILTRFIWFVIARTPGCACLAGHNSGLVRQGSASLAGLQWVCSGQWSKHVHYLIIFLPG
jgi:hypothetical protein